MLVERCKFVVCRGCRKIPASPSSLCDEESRRGSHRRPSHPLGDSPLLPPLSPPRPSEKTQAYISVKSQPIRVHGQWDQTPSQTLSPLSSLLITDNALSFAATRVYMFACLLLACAYVRACTSLPANFAASHPGSRRRQRRWCLAAFSATMLVRPPRQTYTSLVQRRGKQLSFPPDAKLHSSTDFRRRARKSGLKAT